MIEFFLLGGCMRRFRTAILLIHGFTGALYENEYLMNYLEYINKFDVYAKNNSRELLDKIDSYMLANDCKFQIFYSDNTIDIDDYKDPIKSYLETVFIQLNPTLSVRRNMYFMNQHLYDDDSFISLMHSFILKHSLEF